MKELGQALSSHVRQQMVWLYLQDRDSMPHANWYSTINHHKYNTANTHTMKSSNPLLLADGNLRCGMYPAGKVVISQHLITPGFPRFDHTVGKLSADAGVHWNEA